MVFGIGVYLVLGVVFFTCVYALRAKQHSRIWQNIKETPADIAFRLAKKTTGLPYWLAVISWSVIIVPFWPLFLWAVLKAEYNRLTIIYPYEEGERRKKMGENVLVPRRK